MTQHYRFSKDKPKEGRLFIDPNYLKSIEHMTASSKGSDFLDKSVRAYEALLLGFTDPKLLMAFANKQVKVTVQEYDDRYDIDLEVVA